MTGYCPSCRSYYTVAANPPYGVIHLYESGEHIHPITREPLVEAPGEGP